VIVEHDPRGVALMVRGALAALVLRRARVVDAAAETAETATS
jgi:hypothetical protein